MRSSSSRRRLLGTAVVAVATTAFGCSRQPAPPDLSGTWGHQTVFGLDYVCGEALAGGSVRTTECPQPEGGYVVTCSLLPELITEGENVQDALKNANDALAAIVDGFKQLKRPLPSALQPAQENTALLVDTILAL